ncbi:MAG: methyltransferase domain-containing protein [Proteobacteria bacterium]|nr:methyltransferase domain-containing protein [Pseudomonadota bacterium]
MRENMFRGDYSYEYPDEQFIRYFSHIVRNNKIQTVLDLACGGGRHSLVMLENNLDVYGVDLEAGIKTVQERLGKSDFRTKLSNFKIGSLYNIPFEDKRFDLVVCWRAFHYGKKEDILKTLSEIKRVIKKNGIILMAVRSVESTDYTYNTQKELANELGTIIFADRPPIHFFEKNELRTLLLTNKFSIDVLEEYGFTDTGNGIKTRHQWIVVSGKLL